MAEYYAVLSKAVAGLEGSSPDARRAVYDKARNALIGQLKAIDPPLPTAEISRQRLELEEAIRRVERETAAVAAGAPAKAAASRPAAEPARRHAAARQSPQDVFRRAIQEAERESAGGAAPGARAGCDRARRYVVGKRAHRPRSATGAADAIVPALAGLRRGGAARRRAAACARLRLCVGPERPAASGGVRAEPRVDGDDRPAKPRRSGRRAAAAARTDDHDTIERRRAPSRLPTILLVVLIIAMIGGLGALGWSQRDSDLADLLSSISIPAPARPPRRCADAAGRRRRHRQGHRPPAHRRRAGDLPTDVRGVVPRRSGCRAAPARSRMPAPARRRRRRRDRRQRSTQMPWSRNARFSTRSRSMRPPRRRASSPSTPR